MPKDAVKHPLFARAYARIAAHEDSLGGTENRQELLAHRVIWSLVICAILLLTVVPRGWWARIGTRRNLIMLTIVAAFVSVNWGTYIWAVNHGHVLEAVRHRVRGRHQLLRHSGQRDRAGSEREDC